MDSNDLNMLFTTLNAARIMMKNRDRQPHEEAIYTAIQHCQDEVFPRLKADLERATKALEALADATFDAGLTADNTPAWIDARAALTEIAH